MRTGVLRGKNPGKKPLEEIGEGGLSSEVPATRKRAVLIADNEDVPINISIDSLLLFGSDIEQGDRDVLVDAGVKCGRFAPPCP
jgi:hypothetical protein